MGIHANRALQVCRDQDDHSSSRQVKFRAAGSGSRGEKACSVAKGNVVPHESGRSSWSFTAAEGLVGFALDGFPSKPPAPVRGSRDARVVVEFVLLRENGFLGCAKDEGFLALLQQVELAVVAERA